MVFTPRAEDLLDFADSSITERERCGGWLIKEEDDPLKDFTYYGNGDVVRCIKE